MTQWAKAPDPEQGRDRGPIGLVRAWVTVLVRPRAFFRGGVAPGDQAPGLAFGVAVTLAYVVGWFVVAPDAAPVIADRPVVSLVFAVLVTGLLLAPLGLHLAAAICTISLRPVVADRAGVSETVQVIAYAAAPCALTGPPIPGLRVLGAAYATGLLIVGLATVHRTSLARATVAALAPGALVFGYGFGGFAAAETLLFAAARLLGVPLPSTGGG